MAGETIHDGDEKTHAKEIEEFRKLLDPKCNAEIFDDYDCLKLLRARGGNHADAKTMAEDWIKWRHTPFDPVPPR